MSVVLIAACLWVVAASLTAFLPLRLQYMPGSALLIAAPILIWALARTHGAAIALIAVFAVLSLFRRPLLHLLRRAARAGAS